MRVGSAVAEVVQRQIAAGLNIINDGELSKRSFSTYARERLGGFEERPPTPDERPWMISGGDMPEFAEYFASRGGFGSVSANARQVFCVGLLRYISHAVVSDILAIFRHLDASAGRGTLWVRARAQADSLPSPPVVPHEVFVRRHTVEVAPHAVYLREVYP